MYMIMVMVIHLAGQNVHFIFFFFFERSESIFKSYILILYCETLPFSDAFSLQYPYTMCYFFHNRFYLYCHTTKTNLLCSLILPILWYSLRYIHLSRGHREELHNVLNSFYDNDIRKNHGYKL